MRHALAVDLGGTELRAAMVDESGAVLASWPARPIAVAVRPP